LTTAAHNYQPIKGIRVTTIGVTGASGALGSLVLDELLARGVPANSLVALVRDPAKAAERAAAGIDVRQADYDDTAVWPTALAGVDVLLLVSASEPGKRVAQHAAVIDGAKSAGVQRIVYTSLLRADTSQLVLAPDHKATEELLAASGLTVTLLRNGYYIENYTDQLHQYLATGSVPNATDGATITAATRADYAAAAAAVLTAAEHAGRTYELGGTGFTLAELATSITDVTGTAVAERKVTVPELTAILETDAHMPAPVAQFVASLDEGIARGDLATGSTELADILGRPTTSLTDAVRAAFQK
jgi:uncharacterized protein YbjT (DUF2867 family)